MSVKPSNLPRLRRQTRQHLADPESSIRSGTGESNRAGLDALATTLDTADLFWVSQDMAALAMHSGGQLAAARWATADRPAPCGLLFWQDGIGHIDGHGVQVPVEACAWGPFEGGMLLWLLMSRARLAAEVAQIGRYQIVEEQIPPLIPVYGTTLPVTAEPVSFAELDPELPQPVVAALAAAWLLMQQPLLIDRTQERPDKGRATSRWSSRIRCSGRTAGPSRISYGQPWRHRIGGVGQRGGGRLPFIARYVHPKGLNLLKEHQAPAPPCLRSQGDEQQAADPHGHPRRAPGPASRAPRLAEAAARPLRAPPRRAVHLLPLRPLRPRRGHRGPR